MQRPRRRSARMQTTQAIASNKLGPRDSQKKGGKRKTPVFTSSDSDRPEPKRMAKPQQAVDSQPVLDPAQDPRPDETVPSNITQPISCLVHKSLTAAWKVNPANSLCFIFDVVSPARQFKRGLLYDENKQFPDLLSASPGDITERDGSDGDLMPYEPDPYK